MQRLLLGPRVVPVVRLPLAVLALVGYAQDIWSRRREIFDACRDSSNYYESLKEHAFVHGLAATQVPFCVFCV